MVKVRPPPPRRRTKCPRLARPDARPLHARPPPGSSPARPPPTRPETAAPRTRDATPSAGAASVEHLERRAEDRRAAELLARAAVASASSTEM
jgi:hypothetical protein